MEVFIGQPDLLNMDLSWLQDAEKLNSPLLVHIYCYTHPHYSRQNAPGVF